MAEIKPEIKLDPAEGGNLNDIDEYEDDIDLTFPAPDSQSWLVRVPEDLWTQWNEVYNEVEDDQPIEIGKMRIYDQPNHDVKTQKIELRLHAGVPQHQKITKNYDLQVTTEGYSNVCVFTEKDLPGHKAPGFGRNKSTVQQGSRPTGIPSRAERYGRNGRSKSAIPKQTALAPKIQHEAVANPHMDDEYLEKFSKQWEKHKAPKDKVAFIPGIDRGLIPGNNTGSYQGLKAFSTTSRPRDKKAAAARSKDKAVRMDRNDLIDALQRCFRRYRYWSMKALRAELKQPEAWIKEVLEGIAVLVRSGDFAMNYTLRSDMQNIIKDEDNVKDETAEIKSETDTGAGSGDELGDDDLEDDFEDVKMEGGV